MSIYYVYAYLSSKTNLPYYIGKGKDDRAFRKEHNVNLPPDKRFIVFLESNLTELGAFALERRYIKWYGRRDNKTGILLNRTDGGEGVSGWIMSNSHKEKLLKVNTGRKQKPETIEKIRQANTGKKMSAESIQKSVANRKDRTVSEDTRLKLSVAAKGRICTEEHKLKVSQSKKGYKRSPESIEKQKQTRALNRVKQIDDLLTPL